MDSAVAVNSGTSEQPEAIKENMVKYKLIYFNGRGRAECARQIFALAGQEYEDVRLTHEQFAPLKPTFPFGQVPVLEVDGKQLAQSHAISRYLAKQWGLSGGNAFQEALVDSLADQFTDYYVEVKPYVYTMLGFMNCGDLAKLKTEVMMPGREKFLRFVTKFLKNNKSGFLVGDNVTWVDLLISEHVADMSSRMPEFLDGFPEVKAHMEKVRAIPKLKKWLETRPQTPF
ncbi:hypothetical protein Y032_0110g144 [Ancylostoma ceylanicum]|uniref:glutathione transferase n=1 Tax=Ancylostoma ceylanicum TaxID=53326 RepID=A0A016TER2_9BILA|nr:hypothetical protein Y032_0110g144 [Ancylostoma ceylanicum]